MPDVSPWDAVAVQALDLLRAGPERKAFAVIDQQADAMASDAAVGPNPGFREVGPALYWKHRALPAFLALQREHLRRLEASLTGCEEAAVAPLVRALGGSYYNLASFAWPGWEEPGIVIDAEALAAGRAAALRCLEIRRDPAHAAVPFGYTLAIAHWMVGAYHLAAREWDAARESFAQAQRLKQEAGEADVLEAGYLALTDVLERPEDTAAVTAFEGILAQLAARPEDADAACYRQQLVSARRVFEGGEFG
jgi:hypothetical protein